MLACFRLCSCAFFFLLPMQDLTNEILLTAEGLLAKWMHLQCHFSQWLSMIIIRVTFSQTRIGRVTDRFVLRVNHVDCSLQISFERAYSKCWIGITFQYEDSFLLPRWIVHWAMTASIQSLLHYQACRLHWLAKVEKSPKVFINKSESMLPQTLNHIITFFFFFLYTIPSLKAGDLPIITTAVLIGLANKHYCYLFKQYHVLPYKFKMLFVASKAH